LISRSKREIATTRSDDDTSQRHIDHLTVTFEGEDERQFVLDLQLNRQLIPDNYFQKTHKQVGRIQMTSQNPDSTSPDLNFI
jgi:hypothetical protein